VRTVADLQAAVLDRISALSDLELSLSDAHGCVLAEDVVADAPMPAAPRAEADGYAVRHVDVAVATRTAPVSLTVAGVVRPGTQTPFAVQPGLAVRVAAGVPMPTGADTVVPLDWTDHGDATVRIDAVGGPGSYVRPEGAEVGAGALVLQAGTLLGAATIGLLAGIGRRGVRCRPRPRLVVLSVGDELVDLGVPAGPAQVYDANSHALTAAGREAGAVAYDAGIAPDDRRELASLLEDHLVRADMVVVTGGTGADEPLRETLDVMGSVTFDAVSSRPGGLVGFGTVGPDSVPLLALPGEPVAAIVMFELFARPALRRMLGSEVITRPVVNAALATAVTSVAGVRDVVPVRVSHDGARWLATPTAAVGSLRLSGLAAANGLAVIPDDWTDLPEGTGVSVWLLERRGA
jgi:molybdopterin molybdotransferase